MTQPDFNEKTGELKRGDTAVVLTARQRLLFAAIGVDFIATTRLVFKTKIPHSQIGVLMVAFRARLKGLGIAIESKRGSGYRRVVGAMPAKWQPDIPPPVTIENLSLRRKHNRKQNAVTPLRPWTSEEVERGVAMRLDDDMDWDEIAAALGRKSITTVHDKVSREIAKRERGTGVAVIRVGRLTPDQIETRDRRRAGYDARDFTSSFFGDPPKGFSALDRKS